MARIAGRGGSGCRCRTSAAAAAALPATAHPASSPGIGPPWSAGRVSSLYGQVQVLRVGALTNGAIGVPNNSEVVYALAGLKNVTGSYLRQ